MGKRTFKTVGGLTKYSSGPQQVQIYYKLLKSITIIN